MSVTAILVMATMIAGLVQGAFGQTTAGVPGVADSFVYIAGAAKGKAGTIELYRLHTATGKLTDEGSSVTLVDPNFLAVSADQRFLYATCNPKEGALAGFSRDVQTGKLTAINQVWTGGHRAVHVTLEPTGKAALVANYVGNTVAALGIDAEGKLSAPTAAQIQTHTGSGPNVERQPHPFPHSIYCDVSGKFAYSCDLGADQIFCYTLDAGAALLAPADPATMATPPGSGPRHMAFSPNGKFAYVVNEMGDTVIAYEVAAGTGALKQIQSLSTLPKELGHPEQQTGGEIQVHPGGRFLYASNRGPHSSIVLFAIDETSGKMKFVEDVGSGGVHPRHFSIDPSGTLLLAGNMISNTVTVFRIDGETGRLTDTKGGIAVPGPMCVVYALIQ